MITAALTLTLQLVLLGSALGLGVGAMRDLRSERALVVGGQRRRAPRPASVAARSLSRPRRGRRRPRVETYA